MLMLQSAMLPGGKGGLGGGTQQVPDLCGMLAERAGVEEHA